MDFFVVAVKRLRAVACPSRDRLLDSGPIREAIERFDRSWPDLLGARNYSEHILGPGGSLPGGDVWYFHGFHCWSGSAWRAALCC
jgi:hypothetical protein